MFRKMPFVLLAIIALAWVSNQWIPLPLKSFLYAVSLSLKSLIVFVLPFLVFGLLFKTAVQLSKKASRMIVGLLLMICVSNFISTMLSYSVGLFAYQLDLSMTFPSDVVALEPMWNFSLPKLAGNAQAMFGGLILGVILGRWKPALAEKLSVKFEGIIAKILKAFLLIIPAFIAGFIIKMDQDRVMHYIVAHYGWIFALIGSALLIYITFIYWVANRYSVSSCMKSLKNMLPAAIAGFGSMSSAAAMPLTLLGTEKNAKNPDIARSIIPLTVNIHLIGDCFAIPIFAFAIMKSFGMAEPSFVSYLVFALYFVLAKFSVAAVPGGGILVMLPILESCLGFSGEMLSFITALYILFDPVITCANVLGNGGFAMMMEKLFRPKLRKI